MSHELSQLTKEHPILFTPENVRKILDGIKTQTRRIVKSAIPDDADEVFYWKPEHELDRHAPLGLWARKNHGDKDEIYLRWIADSPYGNPGDRLWVREMWSVLDDDDGKPPYYVYKADHPNDRFPGQWPEEFADDPKCGRWKPSIHMPRAACRLWLELTAVRVERVQEISLEDVYAEGYAIMVDGSAPNDFKKPWDAINGAGSWDNNPWLWVLEFKRYVVP